MGQAWDNGGAHPSVGANDVHVYEVNPVSRAMLQIWDKIPAPDARKVPQEVIDDWQEAVSSYRLENIECTIAQIRLDAALLYQKRGELLRQAETIRRQEQHCERCGYRFNYDTHGKPKKPADWCRLDKRLCKRNSKVTSNPDCLASQEQERKSGHRASMSTER